MTAVSLPTDELGAPLPRYDRPPEVDSGPVEVAPSELVAFGELDAALAGSGLTEGSALLLRALLRSGRSATFPGGGVGIEYGRLLKSATRPDHLAPHLREAAAYLRERQADVLVVPGMSGYPVGAMYSAVSGLPALLLKKQRLPLDGAAATFPVGSFVIPSYTGEGDVVMSADLAALEDMVEAVVARQLGEQSGEPAVDLTLRIAGADDIIDKATMSLAVSESALGIGRIAVGRCVARHRARTGDTRTITEDVQVVGWVTPLVKGYNRAAEHLRSRLGTTTFAGLTVTSVHLDPPAIGIDGLGVVLFGDR